MTSYVMKFRKLLPNTVEKRSFIRTGRWWWWWWSAQMTVWLLKQKFCLSVSFLLYVFWFKSIITAHNLWCTFIIFWWKWGLIFQILVKTIQQKRKNKQKWNAVVSLCVVFTWTCGNLQGYWLPCVMSHDDTTVTFILFSQNGNRTSVCNHKLWSEENLKGELKKKLSKMGTKCFFSDCEADSCSSKFAHLLPTMQEAPHDSCSQIFIAPVEVTWLDAASTFLRPVGPNELQKNSQGCGLSVTQAIEGRQTSLWHHKEILSKNCVFVYEVKQQVK